MPKVNRFNKPQTVGYQSQFVPKKLPQDLMVAMLSSKQNKADLGMAQSVKLGEFDQKALGEHDTNYVKGVKDEVQQFADDAMAMDRTSPEFQRKYLELSRKVKQDPNLVKVASAVANYDEYQVNYKRYVAQGNDAAAEALSYDYNKRLENYTKVGGEGFEGQSLGNADIQKGANEFDEVISYFDKLGESGYDAMKKLASGMSYKVGFTGITSKRIQEQASNMFESFASSDAGEQMRLQFLMDDHQLSSSEFSALPAEEREKIGKDVQGSQRQRFMDVGLTKKHGKSTSGEAAARNAQAGLDREAAANLEATISTAETPHTERTGAKSRADIKLAQDDANTKINSRILANQKNIDKGLRGWSPEYLAGQKALLKAGYAQSTRIQKEADADWQAIRKAATKKLSGKLEVIKSTQNEVLLKIPNENVRDQLRLIAQDFPDDMAVFESILDGSLDPVDLEISDTQFKLLSTLKGNRKVLMPFITMADQVNNMQIQASREADHVWNTTYNQPDPKGRAIVQDTGVTMQSGSQYVAAAVEADISGNMESYIFTNSASGKIMPAGGAGLNGEITNVKITGLASSTRGEDNTLTFNAQVTRTVFGPPNSTTGLRPTKSVTTSMNVTPQGETAETRRAMSREFAQIGDMQMRAGKPEQAKRNYTESIKLGNSTLTKTLEKYEVGTKNGQTHGAFSTMAYDMETGTSSLESFEIEVSPEGGYIVTDTNGPVPIEKQFSSINKVNDWVQVVTNSSL